ncbi:unnamed protein product [Rotaria sp. Silwood2]|nr:unnamed protein product [Rotaria sp. Silwood2]CAF2966365.1 unnamed protein product [Rotaria sp. Silwood2]CAF4278998.1 unnamed protein product [Rotaria sp. Silwood2]CAF4635077.1 unnamed protein product [Rotaria sp. Silwood2]
MYNVTDRLMHMLNISHGSLFYLKQELTATMEDRNASKRTLHSRTTTVEDETEFSRAKSPNRPGHSGRPNIVLSEYGKDMLRYELHELLSEKQYPTLHRLLTRLKKDLPDFPINSITTLSKYLKELGFVYRRNASVKTILDSTYFIAERARYFHRLNELEEKGAVIYYQDETWFNLNEKRNIWIESDTGQGRLRTGSGKSKRLIVNALINCNGFHFPSVEVFESDESHTMNSDHFVGWIKRTSGMKNYIRNQNTSFKVQDIRELAAN